MSRPLALLVLLAACAPESADEGRSYVAPLDGQTGVPLDLPLMVRTGGVSIPPEYPVPTLIEVVDLLDGGRIGGTVQVTRDAVVFTPNQPWLRGRRYAWTVPALDLVPHGPDTRTPEDLGGTAVFDTTDDRLDVLGASFDPLTGDTCMVFSRPLTAGDRGSLRFTIDDEPVDDAVVRLVPDADWGRPWELLPGDPGVDVLCVRSRRAAVGAALRAWWGEVGPWYFALDEGPIEDVVIALRRGNW